ncbi:MAG: ArgE/DapE family deacylase [Candidatus Tectomicrobia bacterium]|nr:ArgE/DapE family deacylase [Candidatus Tectomicrobia bacterium]
MDVRVNEDLTLKLLRDLVAINSINPSLVPGGAGEKAMALYIAAYLSSLGLDVREQEAAPGRPNVIGILKGKGGGKSLALNGHMDTVSVEGMETPFQLRIDGGKAYGRGAFDMKGSLAAMLSATEALVTNDVLLRGDLIVTAVVDEEYASIGTDALVKEYHPDAAIVTEPTGLTIVTAHKGFVWIEVETVGKAAHGSRPMDGIDAIMKMGLFLTELDKLEQALRQGRSHPLVGTASLHASLIDGGRELSSYPDRCRLQIERRTIPGEKVEETVREIEAIIHYLSLHDSTFQASSRAFFLRSPFEVPKDETIVQSLHKQVKAITGSPPIYTGQSFWADSAIFSDAGIPTVMFGPGGAGAHSLTEYIEIDQLMTCTQILIETIKDFCG